MLELDPRAESCAKCGGGGEQSRGAAHRLFYDSQVGISSGRNSSVQASYGKASECALSMGGPSGRVTCFSSQQDYWSGVLATQGEVGGENSFSSRCYYKNLIPCASMVSHRVSAEVSSAAKHRVSVNPCTQCARALVTRPGRDVRCALVGMQRAGGSASTPSGIFVRVWAQALVSMAQHIGPKSYSTASSLEVDRAASNVIMLWWFVRFE